jgi:hypothetical protein
MSNSQLAELASSLALDDPGNEPLRWGFAHACVKRVGHLLEDPAVAACLAELGHFAEGSTDRAALEAAAAEAARLANRHPGSKSIDGCGHAAVSASYAVSKALQGKALEAASYAAYAAVYAQGGAAAVADRDSFQPEFDWQAAQLRLLAQREAAGASSA